MIAIDIEGFGLIINAKVQTTISHFNFKDRVSDIKFSPDGKFLAVCFNLSFKIYESPDLY